MITCRFEDNGTSNRLRHLTVDAVLHNGAGDILLVRRAAHLTEGGKWALVGGYMERDETAAEAVRREILEETGYSCDEPLCLAVVTSPTRSGDDRQSVTLLFAACAGELVGEPDDESTQVRWFDQASLDRTELAFDHAALVDVYRQHTEGLINAPLIM
jgi:ADP-ribose pyrophosphatase YjhB (NUDIX family)